MRVFFAAELVCCCCGCGVLSLAGAKGGATGSGEGIESFSGVIYSDDDSDLSVSDIDEGVIARELKGGKPPYIMPSSHIITAYSSFCLHASANAWVAFFQ